MLNVGSSDLPLKIIQSSTFDQFGRLVKRLYLSEAKVCSHGNAFPPIHP